MHVCRCNLTPRGDCNSKSSLTKIQRSGCNLTPRGDCNPFWYALPLLLRWMQPYPSRGLQRFRARILCNHLWMQPYPSRGHKLSPILWSVFRSIGDDFVLFSEFLLARVLLSTLEGKASAALLPVATAMALERCIILAMILLFPCLSLCRAFPFLAHTVFRCAAALPGWESILVSSSKRQICCQPT